MLVLRLSRASMAANASELAVGHRPRTSPAPGEAPGLEPAAAMCLSSASVSTTGRRCSTGAGAQGAASASVKNVLEGCVFMLFSLHRSGRQGRDRAEIALASRGPL